MANSVVVYGQKISLEGDGRGNVVMTLQDEEGEVLAQIGVRQADWYNLLDGLEEKYGIAR